MMMMRGRLGVLASKATALAVVGAFLGLPGAAFAANAPSYATAAGETIRGTIYQVTGRYTLTLQDERGFNDNVTLRDGTIINPTGLSLDSGQAATITGHPAGKTFAADEIDIDPSSISTGQSLLPAIDYAPYGGTYPPYAFTFGLPGDQYYSNNGYYGGYAPAYYYQYGPNYYPVQNQTPQIIPVPGHVPPGYRSTEPIGRRVPGPYRAPAGAPGATRSIPPARAVMPVRAPVFRAPAPVEHAPAPAAPPVSAVRAR